jgi:hypothetical protein
MKSGVLVLMGVITLLLLPAAISGINDFRMTNQTGLHVAATVSPATSANVSLVAVLFNDDITNVSSVTSNNTSDSPLAAAYTSTGKVLNVQGLVTDASRTLTVVYKRDALTDATGASIAAKLLPFMQILAAIGLFAGAVVTATKHGE